MKNEKEVMQRLADWHPEHDAVRDICWLLNAVRQRDDRIAKLERVVEAAKAYDRGRMKEKTFPGKLVLYEFTALHEALAALEDDDA